MNKLHIKTGDTVMIISGRDRGNKGKVLQVSIPRELLGITDDSFEINFKWADNNLTQNGNGQVDILDFYQYGDVAPSGRFKYVYRVD